MSRKVVLVVEDDPMVRADAAMLLDDVGLEVVAFGSADDALAFVADRPEVVAAIFTDIYMPGHSDGLHLADVAARHWPDILVILTSGRAAPIGPLPGNVSFLSKPWLPLDVLNAFKKAAVLADEA